MIFVKGALYKLNSIQWIVGVNCIRKHVCVTVLMLVICRAAWTQAYEIRFQLDSTSCIPHSLCYFVQLRSTSEHGWNLGNQNYRIYYDANQLKYKSGSLESYLSEEKYLPVDVQSVIENVDASHLSDSLVFSSSISFINYSIDLVNLMKGGIDLPVGGGWANTSRLCFDAIESVDSDSMLCIDMVWARRSLTIDYAPAFVVVSEWISNSFSMPAEGTSYIDLGPSNSCMPADMLQVSPNDPLCSGDEYGSLDWKYLGHNAPFQIAMATGESQFDRVEPGWHVVRLIDGAGCIYTRTFYIADPDPIEVDMLDINGPSGSETSDGSIKVMVSGGLPPYSFEWWSDSSLVSNGQDLVNASVGSYFVKVTDNNGCEFISKNVMMDALTADEDLSYDKHVIVFPNPTKETVTISIDDPELSNMRLDIIDTLGRILKSIENVSTGRNLVSLTDYAPGIYYLRVQTPNSQLLLRPIIKI